MSSMALDTHAYYKKLVATGLRDDQAEAIASGLVNGLTENLATKDELFATKQDLQGDINLLRADMNGEFTLVRSEMAAMEERLEGKIDSVEERLRGDMGAMEERLEGKIAIVRTDMADMQMKLMRYMTTLVLGSGGLIIAAMKLLP
jgi:hypothetical protein